MENSLEDFGFLKVFALSFCDAQFWQNPQNSLAYRSYY